MISQNSCRLLFGLLLFSLGLVTQAQTEQTVGEPSQDAIDYFAQQVEAASYFSLMLDAQAETECETHEIEVNPNHLVQLYTCILENVDSGVKTFAMLGRLGHTGAEGMVIVLREGVLMASVELNADPGALLTIPYLTAGDYEVIVVLTDVNLVSIATALLYGFEPVEHKMQSIYFTIE